MLPSDMLQVGGGPNDSTEKTSYTDVYINIDFPEEKSFLWPGPVPTTEKEAGLIEYALKRNAESKEKDFRISFNGEGYRAHRMTTLGGSYLACRKMPRDIWSLDDCKINRGVRESLMDARLNKGGFMIICGKPGNGKSTTCSAIITERLKKFGGLCLTIEDPAEMPLHGSWDEGVCLQREVPYKEFPEAIRDAMRGYPTGVNTMMLIGEIRDPETAVLALQSAVDGRLVVATTHASSVVNGVQRILALAGSVMGMDEARELMAAGFRMSMHQELKEGVMRVTALQDTQSVIGKIKGESLDQLINDVRNQTASINSKKPIDLRPV